MLHSPCHVFFVPIVLWHWISAVAGPALFLGTQTFGPCSLGHSTVPSPFVLTFPTSWHLLSFWKKQEGQASRRAAPSLLILHVQMWHPTFMAKELTRRRKIKWFSGHCLKVRGPIPSGFLINVCGASFSLVTRVSVLP